MYSGSPDDGALAPNYDDRSYVGGQDRSADQPAEHPSNQGAPEERTYEYRGGRDPVTGRAKSQM